MAQAARPGSGFAASRLGRERQSWALLVLVVAAGALARFWNLNWDHGSYTFHPDEWAINQVVRRMGADLNPHFYFYGTLPIYLYRATAEALSFITGMDWLDPIRLPLVGRFYSALAETALLPLLYIVARRLYSTWAGLLAAGLAAGTAILIQAAHFGTVDSLLTLSCVIMLWLSIRITASPGADRALRWYLLAGMLLGVALAIKLTAVTFIVLPLLAHLSRAQDRDGRRTSPFAFARPLLMMLASAAIACVLFSPYYILDAPGLWSAIVVQSNELNGPSPLYVLQFSGSTPYLFELRNLVLWSLGVPLGVTALLGWVWCVVRCAQSATRDVRVNALLLTVWPTLYFLLIGSWQARFVRHTLPLVPFFCLFAAAALQALWRFNTERSWSRWLAGAFAGAVVLGTTLWGAAFTAIYTAPDSRLAATAWISSNVAPGSHVVVEDKNDLVPVLPPRQPETRYKISAVPVAEEDGPAKASDFARELAHGDLLVVPNRRWSAVLPAFSRYALTGRYYALLFSGRLGYTPTASFDNPPHLGAWSWSDDSAEETFQVFDHPTVRLFRNTGHMSEADLQALLAGLP